MKLGLVLEGGASRTYFSVGAMDALMEENIFADYWCICRNSQRRVVCFAPKRAQPGNRNEIFSRQTVYGTAPFAKSQQQKLL